MATKFPTLPPARTTEEMAEFIRKEIDVRGGYLIPKDIAKGVYEAVIEVIIRTCIEEGQFRFPNGWGGLVLKILKGRRNMRLPHGETASFRDRPVIRFREGLATREILGKLSPFERKEYKRKSRRETRIEQPADYTVQEPLAAEAGDREP